MISLSMTAYPGKRMDAFPRWAEKVKALGFEGVEIVSEWPHFLSRENLPPLFKEVLESVGLNVTVHAPPFSDLNIASFNERIRKASLKILEETIRLASELGVKAVTVHPGHCSPVSRKYQKEYIEIHRGSLKALARISTEYGVPVGVENMPKFPILDAQMPERLALLVDGIDIGITFDIGHLNTTTRDFEGFLKLFGDRIVAVHIHDNHGNSDEHLTPGEGNAPWGRILKKLPKVPWVLEVKGLEEGRKGLLFIKSVHW